METKHGVILQAMATEEVNDASRYELFACVSSAWQAHEGELRGYLRHRLSDVDAADDVLQDVFVKAMRQGQGFCTLDNPRAWLFQVARNALVDRARTTHVAEPLQENLLELPMKEPEPIAPVDALAECLVRVLADMPTDDASVLQACDLQGLTVREFSTLNGLSLPATKARLLRARGRLRERLTAVCQVRFDRDGRVCCHVPRSAKT